MVAGSMSMLATRYLRKVVDCSRDLSTAEKGKDESMVRLYLRTAESQEREYLRADAERSVKLQKT